MTHIKKGIKLSCRCVKYPYVYSPFSSINKPRSIVKSSFFRRAKRQLSCRRERPILCVEYSSLSAARKAEWRNPPGRFFFFFFFKQRPIDNLIGCFQRKMFTFVTHKHKTFFTILSPFALGGGV